YLRHNPLDAVTFASSNEAKAREVASILSGLGIAVKFEKLDLVEIQSDSLDEIATAKSKQAFSAIAEPVLVEDDGLFVNSLNGFPGPYSAFVLKTIGNQGILRLLIGNDDRSAI